MNGKKAGPPGARRLPEAASRHRAVAPPTYQGPSPRSTRFCKARPRTHRGTVSMNGNEIVLFKSSDGNVSLPVPAQSDTVWLTQTQMARLFDKDKSVIFRHVKNAIQEGEIDPDVTIAKLAQATGRLRPPDNRQAEDEGPFCRNHLRGVPPWTCVSSNSQTDL